MNNMKRKLKSYEIARRMSKELKDGDVVNLGYGIPLKVANFISDDITVHLHTENGIIGFGGLYSKEEADQKKFDELKLVTNPGAEFLREKPGMCVVDFAESFDAIRTGHVNLTMLGALEVSERGDLSSWVPLESIEEVKLSDISMGGAMDMPVGPERVIVGMRHIDKYGKPKIVKKCKFLLSAKEKVTKIFTDLAVIEVTEKGLLLLEVASGWSAKEIQELTEPELIISKDLKEIEMD
jgi:3-oxoacid CoA-transferase B subunit